MTRVEFAARMEGERARSQAPWISAVLGMLVGAGLFGWIIIHPPTLSPLSFYIAAVSAFHLLEFFALSPPPTEASDAFLLDNGNEYLYSLVLPAIEFAVMFRFMPFLKLHLVFRFLRLIGLMMVLGGQALRTWSILAAGPAFTHLIVGAVAPTQALVTTGPYAHCRHPGYAGYFIWALGLQLILGNVGCLFLFAHVLLLFFKDRIAIEEQALVKRYGEEYERYRQDTVSGLPFIQ